MDQPKVSVIIPVYNAEKYLCECLDSVVNQTLRNIEIICVDDGSTDSSPEILREYKAKDRRFKIITQEKSNAGAARNNGLLHASGEYCIFLDADDFFDPHLLEKSYKKALADHTDIVAFDFYRYYLDGKTEERIGVHKEWLNAETDVFNYRDCPDRIMSIVNPTPWTKLYRTAFILEHNLKYEEISSVDDITFASVSVAFAEHVSILDEHLVYYRVGQGGTITSTASKKLGNVLIAVKSGIKQVSMLPYYSEIKNSAVRFAVDNIVFSFKKYISDFNDPLARRFYEDVKAYFKTPLFKDCSAETLKSGVLYNYYRCIIDKGYIDLAAMITKDTVAAEAGKAGRYSVLKSLTKNQAIIVSLTSYPARINTVVHAIESIKNQTVSADKIILWLAEEQFPAGLESLPAQLRAAVDDCFEIRWCQDLKSHKKYYNVMLEYPDSLIITVDDDLRYPEDMIEKLLLSYLQYPFAVSCMRAHLISFDENGKIAPYAQWGKSNATVSVPTHALFATSGAGTLFPPRCMNHELFNAEAIKTLCLDADDLWLKAMQVLNGTPVVIASEPAPLKYIEGTQEEALWKSKLAEGKNDEWLARILERYDRLLSDKDTITQRIWVSYLSFQDRTLKKEIDALLRDLEQQKQRAERLQKALDNREKEADTLRHDLEKQKKRADTLQYDLDCVHDSISFRVGRIMTYLPRKLRDLYAGIGKTKAGK